MDEIRLRVTVSGHVQGVWFRATTQRRASLLKVVGWVSNLPDGRVRAELQGPRGAVDQVVEWCRVGPQQARVTDIEIEEIPTTSGEKAFWIRR